jgi:hypothetical protein
LFEDDAFHSFTTPMARAATAFLSRHLLGTMTAPGSRLLRILKPAQLRCTKSGQVSVDIPGSRFILDENRAHLGRLATERERVTSEEARAWLLDVVMTGRRRVDLGLRIYWRGRSGGLESQGALWWAQEGLFCHGVLYRDARAGEKTLAVDVGVGDGGTAASTGWVRDVCGAGRAALVLDVSGCGALEPPDHSGRDPLGDDAIMYRLAHTLFRLGDSLVALRVFDVIRALDALESWPGVTVRGVRLSGRGRHGLYAELAAFIDRRVAQVTVQEGMRSWARWVGARNYRHRDIMSVTLPGVLEHFDLPEVESWLGPRFQRLGRPGSGYAENRRKVGR